MEEIVPLLRLECGVTNNDWGKIGDRSFVAKLAAATPSISLPIDRKKPYAELWMGAHPSLPSRHVSTQRTLLEIIENNQTLLSPTISSRFAGKLPFLFKVLSIGKALSIQAHPDKKLAKQLHTRDSIIYPDDNHKPEIVIALTPFEALCGFRPMAEISGFLSTILPLRSLVGNLASENIHSACQTQGGDESTDLEDAALKQAWEVLMNADPRKVTSCVRELVVLATLNREDFARGSRQAQNAGDLADLVIRLEKQHPGDVGVFALFFMNYVQIEPGEALFVRANDLHAYLSGDAIECMASSANVVRAGFSHKFKDISTLVSMLSYHHLPIAMRTVSPAKFLHVTLSVAPHLPKSSSVLYNPPSEEFSVVKTDLNYRDAEATFSEVNGPSIFICTQGGGRPDSGRIPTALG